MISSAVAFQMKGLASTLKCSAQVVMTSVSSATLVKRLRRSRLSVSSLNQRSIRLVHEVRGQGEMQVPAAGVAMASNLLISVPSVRRRLSSTTCTAWPSRDGGVDLLEELQHVSGGVTFSRAGQVLAGGQVHRGGQVDGAVALVVVASCAPAGLERQRGLVRPTLGTGSFHRS